MIQLYHFDNKDFDKNGDIILMPQLCEVTAGINRTWQLDIQHPIDPEGRWKGIVESAVIKAPSFNGEQLWRIVQTQKNDMGVSATCDPICYDAAQEVFFIQKSLNDLTAQAALDSLCEGTDYRGYSDVEGRHSTRYSMANLIEIVQSHENGVQKVWGGEVGFNNHEIQLWEHIGGDPGTVITYGKNIALNGFTESVDIDGVVTRLIPEGYGGRLMDGTPYVDSPLIDNYPTVRIGTINYDYLRLKGDPEGDEEKDGIYYDTKEELDAALREAALQEFADGLDKPKVNLEVDVVLLENTREYQGFKNLDNVTLGDEITCRHAKLDVETQARVIQLRYDCVKERVVYVEIGSRKRNYFDNVSSTIEATRKILTSEGDIVASKIDGFINGAKAQIRLQSTQAVKQDAIAILFEDTDPESETFGALALGTQGLQVSKERQDGEWVWGTAITFAGIIADYVIAGILSDKTGSNYWDLDEGKIVATDIEVTGDIKSGSTISGATISGSTVTSTETDEQTGITNAASLDQGEFQFSRTGTGSGGRMDGYVTIDGSGIQVEYPNATVPYLTSLGYGVKVSNKNDANKFTEITPGGMRVQKDANNFLSISEDNISIYVNGQKVWSAI